MSRIPVMVTGVGGGGYGEQILKALHMAKTPYFIVGGDMDAFSLGLSKVDVPYVLPSAGDEAYIEALLLTCKRHGVRALFPGSESELVAMNPHRSQFEQAEIFLPINPPQVIDLCLDKVRSFEWLSSKGFEVPQTVTINSNEDLETVAFFPAVLKPATGSGGSANLFLAQDQDELFFLGQMLFANIGRFVVQEYVGTVDSEYTVGVLSDMDGTLINSIAVRRGIMSGLSNRIRIPNRTGRNELGPLLAVSSGVSQGDVGRFPLVTGPCEEIFGELGAAGVINVQCRLVDDKAYVFEINPRFSGTTSLRAMMGYNEPDLLIRKHLLGEEIPPHFAYKTGKIVRGLSEVLLSDKEVDRVF